MYTECQGIVLKQIKTAGGRRMIVIFTDKYGKITAGSSINEGGKNKTALALRPFTLGRYEMYKNSDSFSINAAQTLKSFYEIGEDVDKYMAASYVLELTEKYLMEGESQPGLFRLLSDFLVMMQKRSRSYDLLIIGYIQKLLEVSGNRLNLNCCTRCQDEEAELLSVRDGGLVCKSCLSAEETLSPLIFSSDEDIIHILRFIDTHAFSALENLAVSQDRAARTLKFLKLCLSHHLGIENLKTEGLSI